MSVIRTLHAILVVAAGLLGAGPAAAQGDTASSAGQEMCAVGRSDLEGAVVAVVPPPRARLSGFRIGGSGADPFEGWESSRFAEVLAQEVAVLLSARPIRAAAVPSPPDGAWAEPFLRPEKSAAVRPRMEAPPGGVPPGAAYVAVFTWAEFEGELKVATAELPSPSSPNPGAPGGGDSPVPAGGTSEPPRSDATVKAWCEIHMALYRVSDGALVLHQAGTGSVEAPSREPKAEKSRTWRRAMARALKDLGKEIRGAVR